MKRKQFTEAQIAFALRQAESGTPVVESISKMGIAEVTFYRWKRKFAGMGVTELQRLKQLEDENRPQSALGNIPPEEYANRSLEARPILISATNKKTYKNVKLAQESDRR